MKNMSFLFAGVLTSLVALGTTGCSDNNADRNKASTANPSQNETMPNQTMPNQTMQNENMQSTSSQTGVSTSTPSESGDVSSQHMVDPTGTGTGETAPQ